MKADEAAAGGHAPYGMRARLRLTLFVASGTVALLAFHLLRPTAARALRSRLRILLRQRLLDKPIPTFCIASTNHRRWLQPILERHGWRAGAPAGAMLVWQLAKVTLPKDAPPVLNAVPNLLLLDDKAVLGLLTRRFTRTVPLVTHVVYGEWDDARVSGLRERWTDPTCTEPRMWILKDAHASNGFSAALFDRSVRPLVKKDVAGGYCYVLQEYVERPMLIDGRKFEMRQYMLVRGDGAAYTYDGALLRLACVPYEATSRDPRVHITNKYIQTGWETTSQEGRTLDDIERLAHDWPPYSDRLLTEEIVPLCADLADAVAPLVASGLAACPGEAAARARHFELFACDLVVCESGRVYLMEVNINCAFGTFHPRTASRLTNPLFEDLASLCMMPAIEGGPEPRAGRWLQVRAAGFGEEGAAGGGSAADEGTSRALREHQMYMAFKKSHRKKYERQFVARDFCLSDVARDETPKEAAESKCARCGYFECQCPKVAPASRPMSDESCALGDRHDTDRTSG